MSIDRASLGRRLGGVFAGLLVYTLILGWAASGAPVNWGYAVNPANLWWLVSGASYQHFAFSLPVEYLPLRILSVAQLLLTQFGVPGLAAGLYHLFRNTSGSRLSRVGGWVAAVSIVFSLGYFTTDSYLYLLPFFLVFAIWIGFGAGNIAALLGQRKSWMSLGVNGLLLASFWGMAIWNYPKIDLSEDHRAENFEQAVSAALPPQAIVVAKGDQALFSLWYAHFVLKTRPDIAVLADGLLAFPWYLDVLHDTYSTLNISPQDVLSHSIAQANPTRPVCDVMVLDEQLSIVCNRPASLGPGAPYISITQPIEK